MALEWAVTGVFAVVARELVGTRELPSASLPVAVVGLLTGMRAHVSLEMRGLGVRLAASWVRAGVRCGALATPRASSLTSDDLGGGD